MPWLQIKVQTDPEKADQYEDLLLSAGCAAVTLQDAEDQPIFEPELGTTPLWRSTTVTGLFAAEHRIKETLDRLLTEQHSVFGESETQNLFKAEILEDKDWEREWMSHYHPMQFSDKFWVCPSWCEVPDPTAINLMLDPGLAFGTGTHPTTALCLEWLAKQNLKSELVIDYGCGSGILGIAALVLGAESVMGVDIDPQALQATKDNLDRNGLESDRLPVYYPEKVPEIQADTLVANILAGPLKTLAPTLAALMRPGAKLLLSGLLQNQADEVSQHYNQWFEMDPPENKEEWIRLTGIKR